MDSHVEHFSAHDVAQVGKTALDALRGQSSLAARLFRSRLRVREALEHLVNVIGHANPVRWSEADFTDIDAMLDDVISKIEGFQIDHGDSDVALCTYMGEAVKSLRDSQEWLAGGFSPDPDHRPSVDEMRQRAEQRASVLVRGH